MSDLDRIALIDKLRGESAEREWLEFKENHCTPEELGEYLSALANGASAKRRPMGYLLFGVDNDTRDVVGTSFDRMSSNWVLGEEFDSSSKNRSG